MARFHAIDRPLPLDASSGHAGVTTARRVEEQFERDCLVSDIAEAIDDRAGGSESGERLCGPRCSMLDQPTTVLARDRRFWFAIWTRKPPWRPDLPVSEAQPEARERSSAIPRLGS
jgi:hypothetical protein